MEKSNVNGRLKKMISLLEESVRSASGPLTLGYRGRRKKKRTLKGKLKETNRSGTAAFLLPNLKEDLV